jgi:hypothetical protein
VNVMKQKPFPLVAYEYCNKLKFIKYLIGGLVGKSVTFISWSSGLW